jgi:hypothetical protein
MPENVIVGVPRRVEREGRGGRAEIGERRVIVGEDHPHPVEVVALLQDLGERGWPVHITVGPEDAILEVRVPLLVRVGRLVREPGRLAVELVPSHARHELPLEASEAARFRALLEESERDGTVLVVTEDDEHRIIDVRRPGPDVLLPRPLPPRRRPEARGFLTRALDLSWLRDLFEILVWYLFPISYPKATEVFNALNTLSCAPLTVPPPCIPFRYPDDGCWGRAHEMCRLMKGMSVPVRKVWIEGWLGPKTRNHPSCEVHWGWHVAPTVRVRRKFWLLLFTATHVIDPALFTSPVLQSTWQDVQNDPNSTLTPSGSRIFYLWGSITDDDNSQTEGVLATYRSLLQARSLSSVGPPPYAHCP